MSRALDYKAMAAVRGGGGAPWVFAFRPFVRATERIAPIIYNQITNFIAENLTLQFQNINVENSGSNSEINVNAGQNALTFDIGVPALVQP
ncbi:MAG TPA: hypothetical protein VFO28_05880 [Burkholderiaceae bacterium]|nr:hypothetical protein [Burkholderiaceae bacterium]